MNLWPLILKSTTIGIKMYSMIIKMCKVLSKKLKFWEVLDQKPGYQSISLVCSWEDLVTRSLHGCNSITGKPLVFLLVSFPQSLALFLNVYIYSNSPGLSGSLTVTEPISHSCIQVTKTPR